MFTIEYEILNYILLSIRSINDAYYKINGEYPKNKIELGDRLIQYHKDFNEYIEKSCQNDQNSQKLFPPDYSTYCIITFPEPKNDVFLNAKYSMLEMGLTGWSRRMLVLTHDITKIHYYMFRMDDSYIIAYILNNKIIGFRKYENK